MTHDPSLDAFFEIGVAVPLGAHTFDAESIKTFARKYDPQPFHIDEQAAKNSVFGGLCASGWHTAAVWMRMLVDAKRRASEAMTARGEPIAAMGPALGFRDLQWLKPVYVNDTIEYHSEIVDKRTSNSRPGLGLVTIHSKGVNQKGDTVISFVSTTFLQRRPG